MPLYIMTVIDIGLRDIRHRPRCEILAVLGCIAAEIGSLLPSLRDNLSGPSSRVLRCTVMSKMCGIQPTSSTASRLPLQGFSLNSILRILHACVTNSISVVAFGQQCRASSWRRQYIFARISASIGGKFLKLHSCHFPRMLQKRFNFGCDRSIIKGTSLGERSTLSAVSRLPLQRFS